MKNKITRTVENGHFSPGRLAAIKGSGFVNSSSRDQWEIRERFYIEIRQTDVVQKEYNV
jgi:hypothetical protein